LVIPVWGTQTMLRSTIKGLGQLHRPDAHSTLLLSGLARPWLCWLLVVLSAQTSGAAAGSLRPCPALGVTLAPRTLRK